MELSRKGFGAYDVRGLYPEEVNEELAYRVGKAFVQLLGAKRVAVGHDIRLSGPSISEALTRGLTESGCDVVDIGQCGTEMIYFATFHLGLDGGIMVTASHNPKNYNAVEDAMSFEDAEGIGIQHFCPLVTIVACGIATGHDM